MAPVFFETCAPGSAKSVDVVFLQTTRVPERFGVRRAVLLHDLELQLDQTPISSNSNEPWVMRHVDSAIVQDARKTSTGNWFHSLPSSNLPPAFGDRPPHCLKKNATLAFMH